MLLSLRPGSLQADHSDSFEGAQPSWRLAEADCGVRVLAHQRTFRDAQHGSGSEFIRLTAGKGTKLYFTYTLGKAPVIAEFAPSLWIKASRPNVQFMARVVLPRAKDPRTGQNLTTLLRGDMYTEVGTWQRLTVPNPTLLLQREVVILRTQFGKDVDPTEAYVDLFVLNAFTGEGELDLSIDNLQVGGFVTAEGEDIPTLQVDANAGPGLVALQGELLLIDGKPYFPRLIEYQGESLEYLRSLGFNAAYLNQIPDGKLLAEAKRLGMWLVIPPPEEKIDERYNHVLAWNLGRQLSSHEFEAVSERTTKLVRSDPQAQRPAIFGVNSLLERYSRLGGIVLHERPVLGTSFEQANYLPWIKARNERARAGTPTWVGIDTFPSSALLQQLQLLGLANQATWELNLEVVRHQVYSALSSGTRGLLFRSEFPLDESLAGRQRAEVLRLVNHELALLEPWTSAGRLREELKGVPGGARAALLQSSRSRVVLITQNQAGLQYTAGTPPREQIPVTLPGVPISDRPHLLTPLGLQQLNGKHGAAGLQFTLENPGMAAAVVVTQDPLAVQHLFRNSYDARTKLARWKAGLVGNSLATTTEVDRTLNLAGRPQSSIEKSLLEARGYYEESQKLLTRGDLEAMHRYLDRTELGLSRVRRGHWENIAGIFPSPSASVCVSNFSYLPAHVELSERLQSAPWTANLLPAGDMESLPAMLNAGWEQKRLALRKVTTDVALSIETLHGGRSALKLSAIPDEDREPAYVQEPVVTIRSAPIRVAPGQMVRIHGWAYVPRQLQDSFDGLMIYDSQSGPILAERIMQTRGWREFTLYRVAERPGQMWVTFDLTGLGEVALDDVTITAVQAEPIRERGL